jgi:hypothetical protein
MDGLVKMILKIQHSTFHDQGIRAKQREEQGMSLDWKKANVFCRGRGRHFKAVRCYGA